MQKDTKPAARKKSAPIIRKPYLKGRAVSALAAKRGLRVSGYLLISAVLFFFLGQLLALDAAWLRVPLNLAVLAAFAALMYNEGARMGEGDVSFAEIALGRKKDGKTVSQAEIDRCYHPGKGFFTALAGSLPVVLLCLVYAFMAVPDRYTLGALPSWLSAYQSRADISLALSYYNDRTGPQAVDFLRLAVRLLIFPYVNLAGAGNKAALLLVERLSPLLVTIAPMFYGVGYLQGERYRALIHGGIAANERRAARRRKKAQRPQRREPRQLV